MANCNFVLSPTAICERAIRMRALVDLANRLPDDEPPGHNEATDGSDKRSALLGALGDHIEILLAEAMRAEEDAARSPGLRLDEAFDDAHDSQHGAVRALMTLLKQVTTLLDELKLQHCAAMQTINEQEASHA